MTPVCVCLCVFARATLPNDFVTCEHTHITADLDCHTVTIANGGWDDECMIVAAAVAFVSVLLSGYCLQLHSILRQALNTKTSTQY